MDLFDFGGQRSRSQWRMEICCAPNTDLTVLCFLIKLGTHVNHGKPYWFWRSQFKGECHDGYHWQMWGVPGCYALRCYIWSTWFWMGMTICILKFSDIIGYLHAWKNPQLRVKSWNTRSLSPNTSQCHCDLPGPSLSILGMGPGPLKLGKIASFWIELGKISINWKKSVLSFAFRDISGKWTYMHIKSQKHGPGVWGPP